MFVVSHNTSDFGDKYVLKLQALDDNGKNIVVSEALMITDNLAAIKDHMPECCYVLKRMPCDDRVIIESWI
ncbi:hypothetical protein EAY46_15115 [Vibrio anguillarum]|uniref:Uncharacterized protein n=2 Tax=Vibrio anguillarum TaxID=55601 RepID=A0ABR9Z7Z6_VIBAN|nr:hypothetical protein [Vibrio anguillarum]